MKPGRALRPLVGAWLLLATSAALASAAAPDSARLAAFLEHAFEEQVALRPELQTRLGRRTNQSRWDDRSAAGLDAGFALARRQSAELRAGFERGALSPADRLDYDLYLQYLEDVLARQPYRDHRFLFDQMNGVQAELPAFLIGMHRVESVADAEAYVARLHGLRGALEQALGRFEAAAQRGILPPAFAFPHVIDDARNLITGQPFDTGPQDSTLYADFKAKVGALPIAEPERARLLAAARSALLEDVRPGYQRVVATLTRWQPRARGNQGAWSLPDGSAYYALRLRAETTTELSAAQIHALGLAEVQRIHGEMRAIMAELQAEGTLPEFFARLRADPRFYLPEGEAGRAEYLRQANAAITAMQARLPAYFRTLPKASLRVQAVEPFREKSAGKAFYEGPAEDGSRPGTYYVNLHRLGDMPTYELEALAFHEAIPGHHLQVAIATELEGVPRFRRFLQVTAYEEGWALYAEQLAREMGFYTDPHSRFGMLAMELWRACRLVVDTGIHDQRWTREQAIDYLRANTPNPEGQVLKAVERYFVMPGQATAYTIGKLRILELRERARRELGPRFDLREFHDVVLRGGAVGLEVLEAQVAAYVKQPGAAGVTVH